MMLCCSFLPSISLPSRVATNTATFLDNIFYFPGLVHATESFVNLSDMSDHFLVCIHLDLKNSNKQHRDSIRNNSKKQNE